jgi:phage N-6-adenine-methyltransferase
MVHQRFRNFTNEWSTPDSIWLPLAKEFKFTLDVCATPDNARCKRFFTLANDGLKQQWQGVCWMNPPYGQQIKRWVRKAFDAAKNGATVVCLLPARTNTSYWHDLCSQGEIRFVRGYPKFGNAKQGIKFPIAVVIFRPSNTKEAPITSHNSPMLFAPHIPEAGTSA